MNETKMKELISGTVRLPITCEIKLAAYQAVYEAVS